MHRKPHEVYDTLVRGSVRFVFPLLWKIYDDERVESADERVIARAVELLAAILTLDLWGLKTGKRKIEFRLDPSEHPPAAALYTPQNTMYTVYSNGIQEELKHPYRIPLFNRDGCLVRGTNNTHELSGKEHLIVIATRVVRGRFQREGGRLFRTGARSTNGRADSVLRLITSNFAARAYVHDFMNFSLDDLASKFDVEVVEMLVAQELQSGAPIENIFRTLRAEPVPVHRR